ncbi:MAG: ammonium transporter [Phycisphaerales bacterium]
MGQEQLISLLWVSVSSALVLLMQAGFLCLEAGLTRTKHAINVAVKNIADFGLSILLFWATGFGIMFGASHLGWFGTDHFFVDPSAADLAAFFIFQAMFCGAAVTILSGAVAERMKFGGYLGLAAVVSALIYPVVGHWVWGGALGGEPGWLAAIGFVDFAGGSVVHTVGGWAALAAVIVVGARTGRFAEDGTPQTIPASNLPMAVLGGVLLWTGWIGFNGGSSLAFTEATAPIIARTILGGIGGLFVGLVLSRIRLGYHNVMAPVNGALSGLVAVTAGVHALDARSAVVIGAGGAVIAIYVEALMLRRRLDDVVSAVPVHLAAGIWGTLALALAGNPAALGTGLTAGQQLLAQAVGLSVVGAYVFPIVFVTAFVLKRAGCLRVSLEDEQLGLNITEHRASNEALGLLEVIDEHARTRCFNRRAHEEPFTWVGQIARGYNRLVDRLQEARIDVESLRRSEERLQDQEARLRDQAFRDPMTGLLNRIGFRDAMTEMMAAAQRDPNLEFCLLFLDFDQFKMINDGLGHEAGDDLLTKAGSRIAGFVEDLPTDDGLLRRHAGARLGGDEFALLMVTDGGQEQASGWAERLRVLIAEPMDIADREISISVSIGMTMRRKEHQQPAYMVRDADTAMYEAKRAGRNCIVTFDSSMREAGEQRLALTQELRQALSEGQFDVYYQPITERGDGALVGFEALIRWNHPTRGIVSPNDFVPLAEEIGMIQSIGRWLMRRSIRQLANWQARHPREDQPLWVAINLSRRELTEPDLVEYLCELTRDCGVPRESVHLEITESTMMFEAEISAETLEQLHAYGFPISIDDFGTGYSSLACLHSIPFDTLKIDKAFLSEAAGDLSKAAVLEHIIGLAHTFDAQVVAEGVETRAHVDMLERIQCDLLQGYYFARPMPLAQADEMLRRETGERNGKPGDAAKIAPSEDPAADARKAG